MSSKVTASGKSLLAGTAWESLWGNRSRSRRVSVWVVLLHHVVLVKAVVWAVLLLLVHRERLLHNGWRRISRCHIVHEAGCRISRMLGVMW